jgi:hypothetical protein
LAVSGWERQRDERAARRAVPTRVSEAGTWRGPELSWPELVEDGLQLLTGGRFFGWVGVRVGLGRVFPQFDDPPELALVVQHELAVADLAMVRVLNMHPIARLAWLAEQLRRERPPVDAGGG